MRPDSRGAADTPEGLTGRLYSMASMKLVGVDWRLDLRFREKTFSGEVRMQVEDAARRLVLDAAGLAIGSARIDGRPARFEVDAARGELVFPSVPQKAFRLAVSYEGHVEPNSLVGLYASPAGKDYCLTTMLFPTGSRRLLPSFEHPSVKTVYRLTLTVDPSVRAVFNTPPSSERALGERREITFAPTPPMSAYLLYLGVGPFDAITVPGGRWTIRVDTSPGRAAAGRLAAELAPKLLQGYEEYYGMPYPLDKLDLVALENFWAGAMENWGAITFRENLLLVDPDTPVGERRVAIVTLAHEIAHQWFGNLVTPAQWDDFWLNESFATFAGYRILRDRFPELGSDAHLFTRWTDPALRQDSLRSTHPIRVPVPSPEALGEISDEVTYGKGAAVLRMTEAYLGDDVFRRGLSRYLEDHRYANARAEDLWEALDRVSGLPVSRLLTEWTTRPGYPILRVRHSGGSLSIRQERFRCDGTAAEGVWPIPLRVSSPAGEHRVLFDQPELRLPLPSTRGLRVDPGRSVFARVLYDPDLFHSLLGELDAMSPVDQWGLIVDNRAFLYAGLTELDSFLAVLEAAQSIGNELPILAAVSSIGDLSQPLSGSRTFLDAARRFLRAQLGRVGLERRPGETDSDTIVREWAAEWLARLDPGFARDLAPRYGRLDSLPPELRGPVGISFAVAGGEAAVEPLVTRLTSTERQLDRVQTIMALGSFHSPDLVRKTLEMVPGPGIPPAAALNVVGAVCVNPFAGAALYDWYRSRAGSLREMWAGTPLLSIFLRLGLAPMGLGREQEVAGFFREHTPKEAVSAVEQGLEALRLAQRLRSRVGGGPPS